MIKISNSGIEISGEATMVMAEYHLLTKRLYQMISKEIGNEEANKMFTKILFHSVEMASKSREDEN